MEMLDSRRLTGRGLLLDGPGAVVEIQVDDVAASRHRRLARGSHRLLDAVGWAGERSRSDASPAGPASRSPRRSTPSTPRRELNEAAWGAAADSLASGERPGSRARIRRRRRAPARGHRGGAAAGAIAIHDAARASEGSPSSQVRTRSRWGAARACASGRRTRCPTRPDPDWDECTTCRSRSSPGSNGKTTVVRLLAAMLDRRAGCTVGQLDRGRHRRDERPLGEGDYSGPERRPAAASAAGGRGRGAGDGAGRTAATRAAGRAGRRGGRDQHRRRPPGRVRGRQPRGSSRSRSCWWPGGRTSAAGRAERGRSHCWARAASVLAPVVWFSLEPGRPDVAPHLDAGGRAAVLEGDALVLAGGGPREALGRVGELPMTLGGAARHNVANALAAARGRGGPRRSAWTRCARRSAASGATRPTIPGGPTSIELDGVRSSWTTPTIRTGWPRWRQALERVPSTPAAGRHRARRATARTTQRSGSWHGPRWRSGPTGWC